MSPAGSGRGQFRGGLASRVDRGHRCTWMLPWLLPAGLLGTVVLISLFGALTYLLAGIWAGLVFPHVVAYIRAHSRAGGGGDNGNGLRDGEADYWRTKVREPAGPGYFGSCAPCVASSLRRSRRAP